MKKSFILLSLSSIIFLLSCNKEPAVINKYTIKFVNDDGSVLQTSEVEEGKYPLYEGDVPSKEAPTNYEYVYIGWDKPIVAAKENTTYKASYDYVFLLGTYPQTLVTDSNLIVELDKITEHDERGYIAYKDKKYYQHLSEQSYLSDDGTRVAKNDETYKYYEVKDIQWKILGDESTDKFYTTYKLLDTCDFNEESETENPSFPNNYNESELRKYLNSTDEFSNKGFKWRAFGEDDLSQISRPLIRNDEASTCDDPNKYCCEDIVEGTDQVFALSREELRNTDYGFIKKDNIDSKRIAKSTDYARARDATLFTNNASTYWTRSPSSSELGSYKYNVYNVLCDGAIVFNATDFSGRCIRPAIILS